jgi:hypothetical protein
MAINPNKQSPQSVDKKPLVGSVAGTGEEDLFILAGRTQIISARGALAVLLAAAWARARRPVCQAMAGFAAVGLPLPGGKPDLG